MDRKILDYLPPVLREVMEFQAINEANEPEISLAWDALSLVMANQFLDTADRDRKSTRLNSSHSAKSRMPSSA